MRNKIFVFPIILLSAMMLFPADGISAQALPIPEETPLEVDYPEIPSPGAETPETVQSTPLVEYAEYVFYFLVWGSGLLALLVLVYAGFLYIIAVGSPEKLKDAKDRILSALLGLAIVGGSYIVLEKINPKFLVFDLPDVDPLINILSPGVLVCDKEDNPITNIWLLEQSYITRYESIPPQTKRFIRDQIDELLIDVNENCYYVETKGKIRPEFDNKIKEIWFIPDVTYGMNGDEKVITEARHYGAAVFDNSDYTGIGTVYISHFLLGTGLKIPLRYKTMDASEGKDVIKISSIVPFKRYLPTWVSSISNPLQMGNLPDPPLWDVSLYKEKNFNDGFPDREPFLEIGSGMLLYFFGHNDVATGAFIPYPILVEENPYDNNPEGVPISPKSMRVNGDALVILYKDAIEGTAENTYVATPNPIDKNPIGQRGWYFQIFFGNDNNLEDDRNIVNWVACPNYTEGETVQKCAYTGPTQGIGIGATYPCCARAGADAIMIISGFKAL